MDTLKIQEQFVCFYTFIQLQDYRTWSIYEAQNCAVLPSEPFLIPSFEFQLRLRLHMYAAMASALKASSMSSFPGGHVSVMLFRFTFESTGRLSNPLVSFLLSRNASTMRRSSAPAPSCDRPSPCCSFSHSLCHQ